MPSKTPNTGQVHSDITQELKRMRLRTSSSSLRDLNNQPLLNFHSQERTFLHPEEGIVTAKKSDPYIIVGCGHLVSIKAFIDLNQAPGAATDKDHIVGRCHNKRRHRKDPLSAIVCHKCLRRCAKCQNLFCAACTRYDFENKLFYCISCNRFRTMGNGFRFLGAIFLMTFFEQSETPEGQHQ